MASSVAVDYIHEPPRSQADYQQWEPQAPPTSLPSPLNTSRHPHHPHHHHHQRSSDVHPSIMSPIASNCDHLSSPSPVAESRLAQHRRVSSLTPSLHEPSHSRRSSASAFDLRALELEPSITESSVTESSVTESQGDDDGASSTTTTSTVSCHNAFGVFARRRRRPSARRERSEQSERSARSERSAALSPPADVNLSWTRAAHVAPAPELPRLPRHEMRRDLRRRDGEESDDEGDGGGGGRSGRAGAAVSILKDGSPIAAPRQARGVDSAAWGQQLGALPAAALPRPIAGASRQKPPLALRLRRYGERDGCASPATSGELPLMWRPPKTPASSGEMAISEAKEMIFGSTLSSPATSGEMALLEAQRSPASSGEMALSGESAGECAPLPLTPQVSTGGGSMHRSTSPSLWNQLESASKDLLLAARHRRAAHGGRLPSPSPPQHDRRAAKDGAHACHGLSPQPAHKAHHRHGLSLGEIPLNNGTGSSGGSGSDKRSSKGRVAVRASASASALELVDRWSVLPYDNDAREKPRESTRESTRVKPAKARSGSREHGGTAGAAAVPGEFLSSYFGDAPGAYVEEFALQEARNAASNAGSAHKKPAPAQVESISADPAFPSAPAAERKQATCARSCRRRATRRRSGGKGSGRGSGRGGSSGRRNSSGCTSSCNCYGSSRSCSCSKPSTSRTSSTCAPATSSSGARTPPSTAASCCRRTSWAAGSSASFASAWSAARTRSSRAKQSLNPTSWRCRTRRIYATRWR
ncbi:hypothetical protein CLOP_g16534 [Closterium sp. NIES-67]|nr:hypothetical protein CLOP_g16534 [Closterium sp. NIES-67]